MAIVITQRPTQTISAETSYWNAVGNPIVYKLQRKDYVFNQVNDNGGFAEVQINGVNVTTEFFSGDVITVVSDNGVYDAFGAVTSRAFSGGNTLVRTDIPYTAAAPGGYLNNESTKSNYRIQINILDPATSGAINEDPCEYQPTPKGYLLLDVSGMVRPFISPDNNTALTPSAIVDDSTVYLNFVLGYTEIFTDSLETESVDTDTITAVFGALQIPSLYGGNMALYASFIDGTPASKLLTKFDTPVMWRGWPFSISAIVSEEVTDNTAFRAIATTAGTNNIGTPADYSGKVIDAVMTGSAYDNATDTSFTIALRNTTASINLSETKTIELTDPCANPVLLMARNSLGGVLFWMFDFTQDYYYDYGNDVKARRKVLFANHLTINRWDALQEFVTLGDVYRNNIEEFTSSTIKTSTRIGQQVYAVNQDGTKVGVVVIPTRNLTKTKFRKHSFEIEIEYPEEFTP